MNSEDAELLAKASDPIPGKRGLIWNGNVEFRSWSAQLTLRGSEHNRREP